MNEEIVLRYKCANCGNKCLGYKKPDNTVCCERCDKPDWKLMKMQESYLVGRPDYIHPKGEIE